MELPESKWFGLVGAGRFERPTPCAQGRCATRLRYAPTSDASLILNHFPYIRQLSRRPKLAQNRPDGSRHFLWPLATPRQL